MVEKAIQRTVLMMGKYVEAIEDVCDRFSGPPFTLVKPSSFTNPPLLFPLKIRFHRVTFVVWLV